MEIVYYYTNDIVIMEGGQIFTTELLQMMLNEERQKFVAGLGAGSSLRELHTIKNNIQQIYKLLDTSTNNGDASGEPRRDEPNTYTR